MGIINSLLDNDFYKFSMCQAVLHQYPSVNVRWAFKWRNWKDMKLTVPIESLCDQVNQELDHLCTLQFKSDELHYLSTIPFFSQDFVEYLSLLKLKRDHIHAYVSDGELKIEANGTWLSTILFEVPTLAIVSQLYSLLNGDYTFNWRLRGRRNLQHKVSRLNASIHRDQAFRFADFGTRRRANFEWQEEVLKYLIANTGYMFVGTSNVLLAYKLGIKPIGTMAHEYFQAHQQIKSRLIDSQKVALQSWADEYRGELGIALSDTIGFDAFLKDFDRYFALLFDGCRHDSGDPVQWCEKLIAHYEKLRIDPKTKTAIFSDGLSFEIAVDLFRRFGSRINVSFGIGTYLTNDCGFKAPQIVMKLVEVNGLPVAKISDSKGKGMCEDDEFLSYLKKVIRDKINGF